MKNFGINAITRLNQLINKTSAPGLTVPDSLAQRFSHQATMPCLWSALPETAAIVFFSLPCCSAIGIPGI